LFFDLTARFFVDSAAGSEKKPLSMLKRRRSGIKKPPRFFMIEAAAYPLC
jgi:hypothetical protein